MENNKHILIVDDDNGIRDLLKDYLKKNKFIVSTSENAEDAKSVSQSELSAAPLTTIRRSDASA